MVQESTSAQFAPQRTTKLERLKAKINSAKQNSLADQIPDLYAVSLFDAQPQDYLPESSIGKLTQQIAIDKEFQKEPLYLECEDEERRQLTIWIHEHASKVFAITLQCGHEPRLLLASMMLFQESGFDDTSLPISNPRCDASTPLLPRSNAFDRSFWSDLKYYNFYKKQWTCLVPVFSPLQYAYDESPECIFPFASYSLRPKVGAFSSVYKVRIHDDYNKHSDITDVAIKEMRVTQDNDKGETEDAWDREARALVDINKLNHPHITKCIAAIRRGDSCYFMFPWADRDSLRDYWDGTATQGPRRETIYWAIRQLRGLADALDCLHQCRSGQSTQNEKEIPRMRHQNSNVKETNRMGTSKADNIRHGDLKPENILRFMDEEDGLGRLKITDMGLAKRHMIATVDRTQPTTTRYGTVRYEAPEALTDIHGVRSRLYDVWSMGCITFEFVIWLLYGNDALNEFYNQLKGNMDQTGQFFEISNTDGLKHAEVHRVVLHWINHIQETDPECSQDSAIHDLLRVVQGNLLVVHLPPNRGSSTADDRLCTPPVIGETATRYRATADQFRAVLDEILLKKDQPGYLATGKERRNVTLPALNSDIHNSVSAGLAHDACRGLQLQQTAGRGFQNDKFYKK
ncbi:kinase-like protein [Dothidotthia symphoricarpi CBS 119687]|uniref:Kinase-like protein n=1 Tax=Dothidotthia symphoricarpi CBS 119687 TaxID=1392245 RepID=A0A6A6A7L0_9PLEO|nr:kinase-like protein [Dothidotthia symphoricarpi CBS 119687]KAF2127546.1 kinase-like protein [Dothidotthia symphoricarpi CBS 119687]